MGNTAEVAGLSRGINMENMEKGEEMLVKGRNFTWNIILFESKGSVQCRMICTDDSAMPKVGIRGCGCTYSEI